MKNRSRRLRWLLPLAVLLVLAAAGAWLGWTAKKAETRLTAAKAALPGVRTALLAGDATSATDQLARVRRDAAAADAHTHDPVWAIGAAIPLLGEPLATVRGMTSAVRELTVTGLPALASVSDGMKLTTLHPEPDVIDVQRIAAAAGPLQIAAESLEQQRSRVQALKPTWVARVSSGRQELLTLLDPLAVTSRRAATAARVVPPMLGLDKRRRYFVGFQNPAEARGTGGLLGAFAIVTADRGRVTITALGANTDLPEPTGDLEGLEPEFVQRYGEQGATSLWVNANLSPHFPEVAQAWQAMWQAGTGEKLDGAIAIDPAALAAIVRATGPVEAEGIGRISANQIEPLVLVEQYRLTDKAADRKDLMVGVGRAVVGALLAGRGEPRALLNEIGATAADGHILVASNVADEQSVLVSAKIAGNVSETGQPFAQAVVVNAAGSKLDAYLDSTLDYRVDRCVVDARAVTITASLRNSAPTAGLPEYVTRRADEPSYTTALGQNLVDLRVLITKGAAVRSATLDGKPLPFSPAGQLPPTLPADEAAGFLSAGVQGGRPSYGLELELPPGATRTLVLEVEEPPSVLAPLLPRQPLARPPQVRADVLVCAKV